MSKTLLIILLLIGSQQTFASSVIIKREVVVTAPNIHNKKATISNDPCLEEALLAMNYIFAVANSFMSWCWDINTTPQGYADCSNTWILWRKDRVADIYASMTSCPQETFNGWQSRSQK